MNARAVIAGKEYYRISAPQISHSLATEPLSIGNCNAASLKLDVLLEDGEEIPEAASVRIIAQLTDLDVTNRTEFFHSVSSGSIPARTSETCIRSPAMIRC